MGAETDNSMQGGPTSWQADFQQILPKVHSQAIYAFRQLSEEAREEAVQESVCCACLTYARLHGRGDVTAIKPCSLARYAILRCRGGREVGQRRNSQDALSTYARRRRAVCVESLHLRDPESDCWSEILVEDGTITPADLAASRIDYPAFLATLDPRRRQIAEMLASGESTFDVAQTFSVSPARISQLRNEFRAAWDRFVENEAAC